MQEVFFKQEFGVIDMQEERKIISIYFVLNIICLDIANTISQIIAAKTKLDCRNRGNEIMQLKKLSLARGTTETMPQKIYFTRRKRKLSIV